MLLYNNSFIMKSKIAVTALTIYMAVVYFFANGEAFSLFLEILYLLIPVALISMVLIVLKDKSRPYPELGNQEWGYRDKDKNDLGML